MQHVATARNDGGGMVSYIRYTVFADVSLSVCRHLKTPAIHPAPLPRPFSKGLHDKERIEN